MNTHTIHFRHWLVPMVAMAVIGLAGCNSSSIEGDDSTTNAAPIVNAGSDQSIALAGTATLNATVTDDGLPAGSTLSYAWTQDSGPGTTTFADTTAVDTTATFSAAGDYVLRLTADDSDLSGTDTVNVTVTDVANVAPVVDAGPDQSIALAGAATLDATVTDDGLPAGSTLSYAWTQDSGPGTTTFADTTAVDTTATFSAAGDYVLRLTADDSDLSGTDTVNVTVSAVAPSPIVVGVYDSTVVEGATDLGFLVVLSEASMSTVTVDYSTLDGTGVDNEDYQAVNGQLSFAPGETRKTVTVPVLINAAAQATTSKSMHLELSNPGNVTLGRDTGIGHIIDKDQMVNATAFNPGWSTQGVFKNADTCSGCHTASAEGSSPVVMREPITDPNGEDVSPSTQWDHSVMAHAFDDPYYQAAVQDEASHFPHLAGFIEDTCLTCHSPMARTHAHQAGVDLTQDSSCLDPDGCYRLDTADAQDHAREGVSCTACHQIQDDGTLGTAASFSGGYTISDSAMDIYGPYSGPVGNNMRNQTGYTPTLGSHTESSELCATCHTLHTPTLDPETGDPTGDMFLEQGPYFEWQNSVYATGEPQEQQCQGCHMPEPAASYTTKIATSPAGAPDRTPFATHSIVGANTYLLELLREYRTVLGIDGSTTVAGFDEKIAETRTFIENEAAELSIAQASATSDRLNIDILVTNKTGHKLPTSYPSRRAWIHLKVTQGSNVIFESGLPDSKGYLSTDAGRLAADCMASDKLPGFSNDGCFEPHLDVINDPSQIAIYEAVLGDANDHITHTLLLGNSYLKDNRLPPEGFTNSRASTIDAQTVPAGVAGDSNFNCVGTAEGCGTDTVSYSVPITQPNAAYVIEARLLYQAIQPGFVDGLHADGDRVNRFRVMYEEQSPTVETLATDTDQVN
jgi:hypothetical protein